jgi:hypothetical protein
MTVFFRSSVVRFSFQSADLKATKTVDKGAQTLAVGCTCNCTLLSNSILSNVRSSFQKLDLKKTRSSDAGTQTSPQRLITSGTEWSELLEIGINTPLPDSPDKSLDTMQRPRNSQETTLTPRPDYAQVRISGVRFEVFELDFIVPFSMMMHDINCVCRP